VSWLLPTALGIAGVAALVAIALHLIARTRPIAEPLPTARFVPERTIHARTRSIAPSDVFLLLLRLVAIAALGFAVAGPVAAAPRGRVLRIIAADRSRDVASFAEVRDSVGALRRSGGTVIVFDSVATRASGLNPLQDVTRSGAPGSISAALALAEREAVRLAPQADSLELVLVSPMTTEEIDFATRNIRNAWRGRIRLVSVRAATAPPFQPRIESRAGSNDPVLAALALAGVMSTTGQIRLVRDEPTSADTAWARARGRVLLHWPGTDSGATWAPRVPIDALGGVTSSSGTVVGRFPRAWQLAGTPVARWSDGEVAAVEHPLGAGCIRDVGILLDPASDLTLRAPFRRFLAGLLAPCGGGRAMGPSGEGDHRVLTRGGSLAPAAAMRDRSSESSRWTPWLLALAAALLLVELAARRTVRRRA
jgi:hypothetical protein